MNTENDTTPEKYFGGDRIGYQAGVTAAWAAIEKGNELAAIRLPIRAGLAAEIMGLIGHEHPAARTEQRGSWLVFYLPPETLPRQPFSD